MGLIRRDRTPAVALTTEQRRVLLHGPHAVGKTLRDFPHDSLRALWAVHGPALLAAPDCPTRPWFVDRDEFVTFVRRNLI